MLPASFEMKKKTDEIHNFLLQIMTCVLAPLVSNSVLTILVELCAPVTPATAMTGSATERERSPTAWVRPCTPYQDNSSFYKRGDASCSLMFNR